MSLALHLLAIPSIFSGYVFKDLLIGLGTGFGYGTSVALMHFSRTWPKSGEAGLQNK